MITLERLNYEIGIVRGFLRGLLLQEDVKEIHKRIREQLKRLEEND